MDEYLIIDTKINNNGEHITELQSFENNKNNGQKLIIKQFSGINTDNFIISKIDGKKLSFGFFIINGIYYININGEHIIDYNKFINFKKFSYNTTENHLKISNSHFGEMILHNCDVDIFNKALSEMSDYMKNKTSILSNLFYYILTS
jgi:hypothetical protein